MNSWAASATLSSRYLQFTALARTYPNAKLSVLTFAPGGELLEDDPCVAQVLYANKDDPASSVQEVLSYETCDLPYSLIVSDTNHSGVSELIEGYSETHGAEIVTNLWRKPPDDERVGERFVRLLRDDGATDEVKTTPHLFVSEGARAEARASLSHLPRPWVFLCPEAGMKVKGVAARALRHCRSVSCKRCAVRAS